MRFPSSVRTLGRALLVTLVLAHAGPASAAPEIDPLICGEASYVGGVFVATDYAYDDRGANTDVSFPGGDTEYPAALPNAADFIQVQVDLAGGDLRVRAILQTLVDANTPLLGFAFDTDANPLTGAPALPGGAWLPAGPLGVELLLVASSAGGQLYEWSGLAWSATAAVPASVDPATNVVEVTLPAALASPAGATWRAFGVAGLASDSWLAGGPIFDLAFLHAETVVDRQIVIADILAGIATGESTIWQDHRQAEILVGTLDPSEAAASIDFARVAAGDTELASADELGWHTYLYKSQLDLGEGVLYGEQGISFFQTNIYQGNYQPYLIFRNDAPTAPSALVVFLHGASENHLLNTFWYEDSSGQTTTFDFPGIVVFPLGRGESLGYTGASQQDVFDVIADASARLPVDPERIVMSGFSMGGIGTYRLGSLYPDLWTAGVSHAGTTSSEGFDERELMENMLNLPFRAENDTADPLVSPPIYQPDRDKWVELAYDFRFYEVFDGTHQLQPHLINCTLLEAVSRPRVVDPPRVHYAVIPASFESNPTVGYEFHYDSAYWVSEIVVRPGQTKGVVDALSLARADRSTVATPVDQLQDANGHDYCGDNPNITLATQPIGNSWREVSVFHTPGPPEPVSNAAQISLVELASVRFDLPRMSLLTASDLTLEVTGDGPAELQLAGPWGGAVDVLKDGNFFTQLAPTNGVVALADDMSGSHTYVFTSLDLDGDGIPNTTDNCPAAANPDQLDSGGIDTTVPDGIGNACQCGDVSGNGIVTGQDGNAIRRHGLGIQPNPLFVVPGNCDVGGNGVCNGQDGIAVKREALGIAPNPGFGQRCPNADPLVPCPDCAPS